MLWTGRLHDQKNQTAFHPTMNPQCTTGLLFRTAIEVPHHLDHLLFVYYDLLDRILMTDELDASTKPKPRAVHHTAQKFVDLINSN